MQNSDLKTRFRNALVKQFPDREDLYALWDSGDLQGLRQALQNDVQDHEEKAAKKYQHDRPAFAFMLEKHMAEESS